MVVKYLKGDQNIVADSLSRIKQSESQEEIDDIPPEFVGILFNNEDVNWTLDHSEKKNRKKYENKNNN